MEILNLRVFQKKSRNDFSLRLRIQQVVYDQLFSDACNDARQIICLEIQQYWSWKQLRHSSVNTDKMYYGVFTLTETESDTEIEK